MRGRITSFAAVTAALLVSTSSPPQAFADPAQATTSDAWDISQGASNHVSLDGTAFGAPTNAFGGTTNAGTTDQFIFADDPVVQDLEWQTAAPTLIQQIGVFLQHDGSDVNNRRALNLTVGAKVLPTDAFTNILFVQLSANSFGAQYGGGQFGASPTEFHSILPVDTLLPGAQYFRASFVPFGGTFFPGVRVLELDGIVPEPTGLALLALPALALVRRRRA